MESWRNILLTAIPSFLIIFLGAWSDRTGKRKICILIPLVGALLTCLSSLSNAYFFYELPVEVTMFFDAFLPAITGGWVTCFMGAFAYISDITTEKSRTYRIGIAYVCLTVGGPIGSALSGVLLDKIGYYGVFSMCSLLYVVSIMYGCIFIKDPERIVTEKSAKKESSGVWSFVKSFFDIKHVKDTFQVTFKKGPNNRRIKSILILASIFLVYGPACGEATMRYLFFRYRFNWDAMMYSFYTTFFICTHSLGALISITLFSRRLNWDDSILGLISCFSKIIGCIATALAGNTRDMFIGKVGSFFNLVEVLTFMFLVHCTRCCIDILLKLISTITTIEILTIPVLAIFGWFLMQHKKDRHESRRNNTEGNITDDGDKQKENELVIGIDEEHEQVIVH